MADESHKEEPIIIKKKKGHGGHGHHGGAWKVAYADFVTAMMAFFIVMWILGQSEPVKEAVARYFSNTQEYNIFEGTRGDVFVDLGMQPSKLGQGKGIEKGKGSGDDKAEIKGEDDEKHEFTFWIDNKDSTLVKPSAEAKQDSIKAAEKVNKTSSVIEEFVQKLQVQTPELEKILKSITIEMTKEGLKIELMETSENVFFKIGSAELTKEAKIILKELAKEIGKLPNPVEIEGHTDSRQYGSGAVYTNWELSADRANSTRRFLQNNGFWDGQVAQVTGYADRKLKTPDNPFDVHNRRIAILVRHMKESDFMSKK
jgi:chemotaxis protein MotB